MTTKNKSSVVKMGWTIVRFPRWSATAWRRNDAIMRAKPASQTPRFRT